MNTLRVNNFQQKLDIPKAEHEVLAYWDETNAFEKSVEQRPEDKRYVFYDGPPFATGLPHYGHILASTIKDVIPRYWTMKGYRVERVWGWDCHGVPIENMIEKELELKGGKKGIEELGIDKFNRACRSAILRFDKEWEKIIRRIGRWVDFKNSYKTMDKDYMESVWWAFKTMYEKGFVYQGRKVILYCPRCATPLSNFEIAMDNSYKDVEDNSVFVKFKVKEKQNEYLIAWTTTPWTLIGNVGLAVDAKAEYVLVRIENAHYWIAKSRKDAVLGDIGVVEKTVVGSALDGISYEPLYTYMPLDGKKAHYVAVADFVSLADGTGIVHTAAIFGEDDYRLAVEKDLPRVPTLDEQGKFLDFITPLAGVYYKKSETWIMGDLIKRGFMYRAEKIIHSYPFCYRCETPLYYNAVPAWFIDVQKMKRDLCQQNENIHWYPDHLKHGRFGNGLSTAPDWNISRSRYWGTPMPVWQSVDGKTKLIGSLAELKQWAVDPEKVDTLTDIHREFLDDIEVWMDDAKTIKGRRIPEVFDCWVESGSMPYASIHYPFANRDVFEKSHPAQFIAEYIAQTRAWFYTLHVMSVGLFGKYTFENAVTTGTILAEDGTKMSKSKKNYPDPALLFEQYGVDALRFYLMGSVVMKAENLNFSESQVRETYQKLISTVWNVFSFYKLYAGNAVPGDDVPEPAHVLDRWIVGQTESLILEVTTALNVYDTASACRVILDFVTELSTWYLRRSRDRLKNDELAVSVFGWVLIQLVKVMAPLTPFITERIYQNLKGDMSVHLTTWPGARLSSEAKNSTLNDNMLLVRQICELGHAARKEKGIKVRQPLRSCQLSVVSGQLDEELLALVREELNVKSVVVQKGDGELAVTLDTDITPDLVAEGQARELIRQIQMLRREKGCKIDERISVQLPNIYEGLPKELASIIQKETLADALTWGETLSILTG
ncbi:isoleucine--tRNA ligase [Candidatus Gottesmanbacteria bacterium]|nr:isoleucine--tRNA ligase [Candidatus Gottesmanbacteria bacterium]